LRAFSADLRARQTAVTVPSEFLRADTDYKLEVIDVAHNGNQTITETEFSTQ
jgi:hypothetical protein